MPAILGTFGAACLLGSCSVFQDMPETMPARSEEYSYLGPGGNLVLKGRFKPILFAQDSAELTEKEAKKLQEVSAYAQNGDGVRIILAAFSQDPGTEEYNRMLGEQRAQGVRAELISLGVEPGAIQTVSYGKEPGGRAAEEGMRVEIGIVD